MWAASYAYAAAQPTVGNFDAVQASAEVTDALARQNLDVAATAASRLMVSTSAEKLKGVFQFVTDLGQSQYSDLIYARDYGRTEKDIIYKIDYAKSFLLVRFLYHVDNGAWRLFRIRLKVEMDEAFPKDWLHIYPK
jgi:hypothetical protein